MKRREPRETEIDVRLARAATTARAEARGIEVLEHEEPSIASALAFDQARDATRRIAALREAAIPRELDVVGVALSTMRAIARAPRRGRDRFDDRGPIAAALERHAIDLAVATP